MPKPTDYRTRPRRPTVLRASAATLAAALTLAATVPPLASAREAESEGAGSGPPGLILPGLEEGFEPGGEETSLGEVGVGPGEEEAEEAPPIAVEEPTAPEVGEAGPSVGLEVSSPTVEAVPRVAEAPAPGSTAPVYEAAEEAGPSYEIEAPTPSPEAVRNEPIVAPGGPGAKATPEKSRQRTKAPPVVVGEAAETGPVEAPAEPPASPPVAVTATISPASLSGRKEHTVDPGECLWSIAEGVLPTGVTDAEIAAEVSMLWHLNAARIGTGDPGLIYAGTVLRLR